ncbi:hypothetical protein P171DRAFT_484766 [Karstenula rhodostoma CBS 690.94]|uniref:MIF4G domain-containing protein n=1 Tax=Karstenula rhodostoma CBS 690.94 TaxID=1392251 RepID=A0A9P4PGJ1_9PLEO|nr:hypothetical protein P171DRAFT_484766 [Karstenula rhodostoma CBS 690.94]
MTSTSTNAQNPPTVAASKPSAPANLSSSGSSAVAAGQAAPTARSSYANATKSPPIANSAAPVVVGGSSNGKSISPVNGNSIKPAVPAMGPTIANGAASQGDHSRKSSVTISAAGTSGYIPNGGPTPNSRAPSNLTFGSIAGSPAPAHAVPHPQGQNLNPQASNPRVASPAHSPSPIPTPISSGGKPDNLPTRPNLVFGGGADADPNARNISLPPQPNSLPQAQHLRRESSQSAHSDMSNPNMNRGFAPGGGRGRGYNNYPPMQQHQHPGASPQPFRAMPNQSRGPHMAPSFQPQMQPNSPYRANRSPAITPAAIHQQANYSGYGYNPQQPYAQPVRNFSIIPPVSESCKSAQPTQPSRTQLSSQSYPVPSAATKHPDSRERRGSSVYSGLFDSLVPPFSSKFIDEQFLTEVQQTQAMYGPPQGLDPYNGYYGQNYPGQNYGMPQGMHYPGVPASPGRGGYPQQAYPVPGYGQPPQAQGMSRTPSNISERPPSAAQQPSTPAMTNVSHVSQTPSAPSGSPAPGASFAIPPKTKSKAIVIKTADGQVVDFNTSKKPASPAQPPAPSKSPAIVATPTPPPRPESTHSRAESVAAKSASDVKADFIKQFQQQLQGKDEDKKKAAEAKEAEEKAQKEKEEKEQAEAAAKAQAEKEAQEKEAAEAAEKEAAEEAKRKAEEEERKAAEEMERMIEEMERAEKEEEERERKFAEEKKKKLEAEKAREAEKAKEADERMKQAEREAEEREAAKEAETPEQKAEREKANREAFAGLKKNTMFGPAATQTEEEEAPAPPAEPTVIPPTQAKSAGAGKPKPAHLKLETTKAVEPPAPTPGMMSLKSARFLQVKSELVKYPEGIQSPNPALNVGTKSKGKVYEPSFLLQFQDVFKEKPSVDWDMKLKETVGDSSESAGPKSARGAPSGMGGRQPSRSGLGGPMGSFTGSFPTGRTLPPGTTSAQRFEAAQRSGGPMTNPLAQLVGPPRAGGGFPVQMARTSSFQSMAPNSPRVGSSRGRGSRRGDKPANKKEEAAMPLTAGMDLKPLEKSTTGWTPHSKSQQAAAQLAAGHLAPDMVQRKVKAALNKLTPEKFDKISDQILEIAAQSKNEDDGRTLRQVIQLTFEKACDEQHWSSMYAKFCFKMLNTMDPAIRDENVKDKHGQPVVGGALFRKYLLNRCQEEFEKGWEVNLPAKPDGEKQEEVLLSDEYYVAAAAKRKGLGLIQFIGELYKLNMLTLRIMHECVLKLLDFEGLPDESAIESLVKLLRTVGATMSTADAGPKMLSVYFERVEKIMNMEALPSRLKFMLLDLVDLRRGNWRDKQADKGPKTIQQIHAEAAAAQQAAAQSAANNRGGRLPQGRGDARSFSGGGIPPPQDFGSRVAMDDLRKLTKGSSGRNSSGIGPSMLGGRSGSGRRGLGPGGAFGAGAESGASSRTTTPPVQKEKESTSHANSFSALMALDNEGAEEVSSPPPAASPQPSKAAPGASATDAKPSE